MALAPAGGLTYSPAPEPEPVIGPEPSPAGGSAPTGRLPIFLAVVVAALLIFNGWYFALAKPADDQRTRQQFQSLLTDIFSKLVELTGDKYAKTALQAFQSMQEVFQALVSLNEINQQWSRYCDSSSSQTLFRSIGNISDRYNETCIAFGPLRAHYASDLVQAGSDLGTLVMALVKLDNAIAADP